MKVSVVIVSYNVREFLQQALASLERALSGIKHEIFVVDNASSDSSVEYVRRSFPKVKVIANAENVGFARANNQAIARCSGEFVCLINPDTVVQEDTFSVLLDFFARNSDAGATSCKVLNPDGSLQLACRRSYPTPWVAFTKIIGLARLFPHSRLFGRYNLTYLDPGQVAPVDAISGSFMFVRKSVIDSVGMLDESFFMYGEDLDWCFRIKQGGWNIYYVPDTQIIHFKGESSKKSPFEQRRLFYEAMRLFVKKHFNRGGAFLPSWILVLAIYMRGLLSFVSGTAKYMLRPCIDFLVMTFSLAAAIYLRFYPEFPWRPFVPVHLFYSIILLLSLTSHGVYSRWRFSGTKSLSAVGIGWLINSSLTFFFKQYAFSRQVVLLAGAINFVTIPGWRFSINWLANRNIEIFKRLLGRALWQRRAVVVGDIRSAQKIIRRLKTRVNAPYFLHGVVLTQVDRVEDKIEGLTVLGELDHLDQIIEREKVQEVIFSTDRLPYDRILATVAGAHGSHISFKLVPSNVDVIIGKATIDYLDNIPFVDLDYRLHAAFNRFLKRLFDLALALPLLVLGSGILAWHRWVRGVHFVRTPVQGFEGRTVYLEKFEKKVWCHQLANLFSIIRGDVSFVGREIDSDVTFQAGDTALLVKPGLTGLEQINAHLDLNEEDRIKYLLYYLKNYTILTDWKILLLSLFKKQRV
ncbi:glycosyltransferase [candidate division KSB1 bacterium]|nr:glycosyltransferase [candidate division KSB1 bacterium]